jgi:DNA-binding NarL/FixJ family response regulator
MATVSKSELVKLQKSLGTDAEIGKKFGITRQAIHQLRKKFGIVSRYAKNPERNEKILSLYGKGTSGTAIAEKLGLSISQTYRIINTRKEKPKKVPKKRK